jgi:hypothetical protein
MFVFLSVPIMLKSKPKSEVIVIITSIITTNTSFDGFDKPSTILGLLYPRVYRHDHHAKCTLPQKALCANNVPGNEQTVKIDSEPERCWRCKSYH